MAEIGPVGDREGQDIDLVSASLRASSRDVNTFLDILAEKLEAALPGRVVVERRSLRFLGKKKRVESVQCELGGCRYVLVRNRGGVEARRATVVRGVVLKSEPLQLDDWIDGFARDLSADADLSEQTQRAFEQLLDA